MSHSTAVFSERFPFLHMSPSTIPPSEDPFTITTSTGFLPHTIPLKELPACFEPLSTILDKLPIVTADGSPGILAGFKLGLTVEAHFPDLTAEVHKILNPPAGQPDFNLITALFRDYAFLASAYLLEPCWETWKRNPDAGEYGLGRDCLPAKIARPLYKCAEALSIPPFMSYAAAYTLYNYTLTNPSDGMAYSNLRLIRAFEKGLDPTSSEAGFVLTHIDMVQHSPSLVAGTITALDAIPRSDRASFNSGLRTILSSMSAIESSMEFMWSRSKPSDYLSFRTFIFGITSQSMFPHGVIYSGIHNNNNNNNNDDHHHHHTSEPLYFRGESGANDSMIPLLDALCEVPFPSTPLTTILHEFRSYRPKPHRDFLTSVRETSHELGVQAFATSTTTSTTTISTTSTTHDDTDDKTMTPPLPPPLPTTTTTEEEMETESTILYLSVLDRIRSFRWRHWLFAREYIIKRSLHPTATGGSPIVTWLPNQLFAVMDLMVRVFDDDDDDGVSPRASTARGSDGDDNGDGDDNDDRRDHRVRHCRRHRRHRLDTTCGEMMEVVKSQRERLGREVERWCSERGVATRC